MHCNRGLGGFKDDVLRLLGAADYLTRKDTTMTSPLLALLRGQAPDAEPAPPAAAAVPVPAPQQAPVTQSAGSPAADLAQLLRSFSERSGVAPTVNPPEAAKVLATKTAAEVAGAAEPDPDAEPETPDVEPPTSKPAALVAQENEKRSRRTAAVVQAELDLVLEQNAELQKALLAAQSSGNSTELTAEIALVLADKDKAYARADALQQQLDELTPQVQTIIGQLTDEKNRLANELEAHLASHSGGAPVGVQSVEALVRELAHRGFRVTLEVPAS
jgi:hypothetical protein